MDQEHETKTPTNNSNPMMLMGIVAVVAVVGLVGFTMMNSNKSATPAGGTTTPSGSEAMTAEDIDKTITQGAAMEGSTNPAENLGDSESEIATQTVTIEAGAFYYKPNVIKVKQGTKVKVVINSVDMMHDFNIDALEVKVPIAKSGETQSTEFVASTKGEFEFYCSVGQHKANGQVGTLIVE